MKRCPVEAVGVKCSFWCKVWPLEWDGVEYKGVLSKRDRSEFKPVGFNQTSVWVLGEKLYIWKGQQFGLAGENCALEYMACCYHCKGTAPEYRGFPHCVPSPAKSLGIAWMQWEQYSCGSKGCFITSQTPNSSPVYALRDILYTVVLAMWRYPETIARSWRRPSIQGCKSLVKFGSISKDDGSFFKFLF